MRAAFFLPHFVKLGVGWGWVHRRSDVDRGEVVLVDHEVVRGPAVSPVLRWLFNARNMDGCVLLRALATQCRIETPLDVLHDKKLKMRLTSSKIESCRLMVTE